MFELLLSLAAAAFSSAPALRDDVRCMTAFALAAADTDNDADYAKRERAVIYFIGRIERASPGVDYGAAIMAEKPFVMKNGSAVLGRCLNEYSSVAERAAKIGPALEK